MQFVFIIKILALDSFLAKNLRECLCKALNGNNFCQIIRYLFDMSWKCQLLALDDIKYHLKKTESLEVVFRPYVLIWER